MTSNLAIERSVLMRQRVIVPECNQRAQFQLNSAVSPTMEMVLDHCGVLAVNHKHGFFERNFADGECEYRVRIEPELVQVNVSPWINRGRILVCRKIVAFVINDKSLFELG